MLNVPFIFNLVTFWIMYNVIIFALKRNPIGLRILSRLSFFGFQFGWLQIRLFTTRFNRPLARLVTRFRLIMWRRWFAVGALFTCLITLASFIFLSLLLFNTIIEKLSSPPQLAESTDNSVAADEKTSQKALVPLVPGVNLPTSHIGYVLVAVFVSAVFHEMGHAIAALSDQVRLNGCGVFVFLIYPGAYVDLSTDNLHDASPMYQLRIYCAGVWHNFIMCVISAALIVCLPLFIWSLVYNIDTGVVVTAVVDGSPLSGARGLALGDELTAVGNCSVTSSLDWRQCIVKTLNEPQIGNCMLPSTAGYNSGKTNTLDCCSTNSSLSRTSACFYFKKSSEGHGKTFSCLVAHYVINDRPFCLGNDDCVSQPSHLLDILAIEERAKQQRPVCVFPKVEPTTRLLSVFRRHRKPLLFYGYPSDLLYFSTVSDYIPVTSALPAEVPIVIDTMLRYILSLSLALALLNAVPCYGLDGQHILGAVIEHCFPQSPLTRRPYSFVYFAVLALGSFVLFANIILAFSNLF